ncbi:MAG: hypothetical protein QM813_07735 [Verrucomicrobiota bacterium]
MARLHSCNVLKSTGNDRQLWQFNAQGNFPLAREQKATNGETLSASLAHKSWGQLWQPRLNIALLPPDNVFFRVVHLPPSTFAETLSMVELQLEKLSPIPVGQVVWSAYVLPPAASAAANDLQTLIVVFVERKVVEDFLGQLETAGYLADRLELSALDQIATAKIDGNGAWIYPGAGGGPDTALVAWWYGGKLHSLNPLTMPASGDRAESLKEQLAQMAWAGELEGWLTALPQWTLVADDETVAQWETPLRQGLDAPIQLVHPLPAAEFAALTAKRAAGSDGKGNLIPPEFATRYRNQFFDRLWIRGVFAVGAIYFLLVGVYIAAVSVQDYRVGGVEAKVEGLSEDYTNALQLKARFQVLKTREELKFAALDCWKVTAELLPETLTLESFGFSDGRKLALSGTAPGDSVGDVNKFYGDIRKAMVNGQPIFDFNKGQQLSTRAMPGGLVSWNFGLELKRTEGE